MKGQHLLLAVAIVALAGCSVSINSNGNAADDGAGNIAEPAADDASPQTANAPVAPPATPDAAATWRRVRLDGVTSGDNFYLDITPAEGGSSEQVMCAADACRPWFDAGDLPASMRGTIAEVQMGTTEQVDSEGTVMEANFPAVVALRPTER